MQQSTGWKCSNGMASRLCTNFLTSGGEGFRCKTATACRAPQRLWSHNTGAGAWAGGSKSRIDLPGAKTSRTSERCPPSPNRAIRFHRCNWVCTGSYHIANYDTHRGMLVGFYHREQRGLRRPTPRQTTCRRGMGVIVGVDCTDLDTSVLTRRTHPGGDLETLRRGPRDTPSGMSRGHFDFGPHIVLEHELPSTTSH